MATANTPDLAGKQQHRYTLASLLAVFGPGKFTRDKLSLRTDNCCLTKLSLTANRIGHFGETGAGDEIRTHDTQHGKLVLYP